MNQDTRPSPRLLGARLADPEARDKAVAAIARAFEEAKGNAKLAAKLLGCHRATLYVWRDTYPAVRAIFDNPIPTN